MGFFDKVKKLADAAGEIIKENNDNVVEESTEAFESKYRDTVLATPPPPEVPSASESMSVRIAVNGKEYGPYERANLLEMIGNGTLTRETYVFMEGMSEWKKAKDVNKVAVLFGSDVPLPPAPPAPWANSQNIVQDTAASDNSLSPRLNQLITSAVADGEISDLERQVLIRNAQKEGVDMDEFVMVLEARLFEQRRVLVQQEEEKRLRAESLKAQQQAAERVQIVSTTPASAANKSKKCPHCGAPVKALATACPECGHDYMDIESHSESSASERLSMQLQKVDNEKPKEAKGLIGGLYSLLGDDSDDYWDKIRKKKNIIKNFPIPSDKRGILDLFITCATQSKTSFFNANDRSHLEDAYKTKAQQVLLKARIVMKDDPKLLEEIESYAKQYKIKP